MLPSHPIQRLPKGDLFMRRMIEAACGCHIGKIRKNNEDNFFFAGKHLDSDNVGLEVPLSYVGPIKNGFSIAVFDGMGGENFGEIASYTAAKEMQRTKKTIKELLVSDEKYLNGQLLRLNDAVVLAKKELCTDRMGTTMVGLYFSMGYAYISNIGDSRAYRLRNNVFIQLSQDHVLKRLGREGKKAPLTQHLGIDPEDMLIEPYTIRDKLQTGDVYLLCSDGLTDMLTDFEISEIMQNSENSIACVNRLIETALLHGGRDNITAVVCKVN